MVKVSQRRDRNTSLGLCMNLQGREDEGWIVNCVVIVINCGLITLSECQSVRTQPSESVKPHWTHQVSDKIVYDHH